MAIGKPETIDAAPLRAAAPAKDIAEETLAFARAGFLVSRGMGDQAAATPPSPGEESRRGDVAAELIEAQPVFGQIKPGEAVGSAPGTASTRIGMAKLLEKTQEVDEFGHKKRTLALRNTRSLRRFRTWLAPRAPSLQLKSRGSYRAVRHGCATDSPLPIPLAAPTSANVPIYADLTNVDADRSLQSGCARRMLPRLLGRGRPCAASPDGGRSDEAATRSKAAAHSEPKANRSRGRPTTIMAMASRSQEANERASPSPPWRMLRNRRSDVGVRMSNLTSVERTPAVCAGANIATLAGSLTRPVC
jgi:hypothetical protein